MVRSLIIVSHIVWHKTVKTVAEVLNAYLKDVAKKKGAGTLRFNRQAIVDNSKGTRKVKRPFVPFLIFNIGDDDDANVKLIGELPIDEPMPDHVDGWIDTHYADRSYTYKHDLKKPLRQATRWACSRKGRLLTVNPLDGMERPTPGSRAILLSDKQWAHVTARLNPDGLAIEPENFAELNPFLLLLIVLEQSGAQPQELRTATARFRSEAAQRAANSAGFKYPSDPCGR